MINAPKIFRALVSLSILAMPLFALAEAELVGTWALQSMISRDEQTGVETKLWGERPVGFLTYTRGGRMIAVVRTSANEDKASTMTSSGYNVEDQARMFRAAFAYAGSYSLTHNGVVNHVEVATDPTWIGQDQERFIRIEGNKLVITTPIIKSTAYPNPRVFSLIWERVE